MPPIGETLREARMRQRLDIADVEERTKIRAKYLRALENEEWGLLPGPTFVKTFLRTYAEVVGVDPHLLVEEYRTHHEPRDEYDYQPLAPQPQRDLIRERTRQALGGGPSPPSRGLALGVVAAAVVAFLLALGLLAGGEDDGDDGVQPRADTAPAATDRQPRGQRQATTRERAAPAGVVVRVAPIEPTYACVDRGQGTDVLFEGTLDAVRTFRGPRVVRLNLGRRSATVTRNGEPVEFPDSAEPLGLELTPDEAIDISSGERPCA